MRAPISLLAAFLPLAAACASPSPVPPTIEIAAASSAASAEPDPPPAEGTAPRAAAPERRAERQPGATSDEGLPLPSSAPPPSPPPNPQLVQAREAFKHGVELYNNGNYRDAANAFLSAYQILPKPQVLFNAANAALQAGDTALACRLFAQWKQDASPSPAELARASELAQRCP